MNIIVGVTAGIASYKTVELVRLLAKQEHTVQVVLTKNAHQFVGEHTFQAVSGLPVRTDLFDPTHEAAMGHIELAKWADLIIVAPATANSLAKFAHGMADDLLSTLLLATNAPVFVAPAMNQAMWSHPATQANIEILNKREIGILGPAAGEQACGDNGPGRMLEPVQIVASMLASAAKPLSITITAGPTYEAIDPVRFIGNRSSGKMGYAIAAAFADVGHNVTLVSGPVALSVPRNVVVKNVESTADMLAAATADIKSCDIFVSAAAVSDYRVQAPATEKIKKQVM